MLSIFGQQKGSASINLGPSSFEMSCRGGFNGNNGAFHYPNPEISNFSKMVPYSGVEEPRILRSFSALWDAQDQGLAGCMILWGKASPAPCCRAQATNAKNRIRLRDPIFGIFCIC